MNLKKNESSYLYYSWVKKRASEKILNANLREKKNLLKKKTLETNLQLSLTIQSTGYTIDEETSIFT